VKNNSVQLKQMYKYSGLAVLDFKKTLERTVDENIFNINIFYSKYNLFNLGGIIRFNVWNVNNFNDRNYAIVY
jgi:hypothetical protein